MSRRRMSTLLAAGLLTLGACASGSDDTAVPAEPVTTADSAEAVASTDAAEAPATDPPATEAPLATSADESSDVSSTEPPEVAAPVTDEADAAADAPTTEAAPAEEAEEPAPPPTEPAAPEIGGRAFATEVAAASQFESNPFPDLVVDDIGRAGSANLANIVPADRPVLLWAWAPH